MSESPDAIEGPDGDQESRVTAHRCNAERTVFTERENSDGWIATDITVDIER